MEYPGFDSAGITVLNGSFSVVKQMGNIALLGDSVKESNEELSGVAIGIVHTRWVMHGDPSDRNAHPQTNVEGDIELIHNVIIENCAVLCVELTKHGYTFTSDTNFEDFMHHIDHLWKSIPFLDFEICRRMPLIVVEEAYGICAVSNRKPDSMIVERKGNPLVIGIGDHEFCIAFDAALLVEYTRKVVYLADGEMAIVRRDGYKVKTIDNIEQEKVFTELDFELEEIEKGGYEHFMLKEIFEQSEVMQDVMRGRVRLEELGEAKRIIICACGT